MLRLEIESTEQLMRLYQVIMAGKFTRDGEALLVDKSMAAVSHQIVDTLISEARTAENTALVDAMEHMRELQPHYPQYARLIEYFGAWPDWEALSEDYQTTLIRYAAAPLILTSNIMTSLMDGIAAARGECKENPQNDNKGE